MSAPIDRLEAALAEYRVVFVGHPASYDLADDIAAILADARALREAVALLAEARDPVFFLAATRGMYDETLRRIDAFLAAHPEVPDAR